MRQTSPDDVLSYCKKWVEFEKRFQELMPVISVYSNVYFDFYTSDLSNYNIRNYITWGCAVVPASYYNAGQVMADMVAAEKTAVEEEPEPEEDQVSEDW